MIVCETKKELENATNTGDAAGAVAVKEYVEGILTPVDVSNLITLISTLNTVTLVYAYKVNNLLFIQFKCDADDDVTVSGGDDWGRATISGLSLKSDRLTAMCEYVLETDLASIAYLTDTSIVFHALPFAVGDDGASAYATFVALLN